MNDLITRSLRVVWYRRRRIFVSTIVLTLLSIFISVAWMRVMPLYEGTTIITTLPSNAEIVFASQQEKAPGSSPALSLSQTHTEFLLSKTIAEKVIDTLISQFKVEQKQASFFQKIVDNFIQPFVSNIFIGLSYINYGTYIEPTEKEVLTSTIQQRIKIRNVPGSYVLSISVLWTDPLTAQKAANYLAEIYVENSKQENLRSLSETKKFIEDKLEFHQQLLYQLENDSKEFKKTAKISLFSKDVSMLMDELAQYTQEKTRLELKLLELESKIRNFKEIETQTNNITLSADYESTKDRILSIEKIIGSYENRVQKIPNIEFRFFELEQKKKSIEATIAGLQSDLIKTNISEAGTISAIRIIDTAIVSPYPKYPKILQNVFFAFILGLIIGFGWILISESFSPRIRFKGDLKSTKIKWIGLVPRKYGNNVFPWQKLTRASNDTIEKHVQFLIDSISDSRECKVSQLVTFANPGFQFNLIKTFVEKMPQSTLVINLEKETNEMFLNYMGKKMSNTFHEDSPLSPIQISQNVSYLQWIGTKLDKAFVELFSENLNVYKKNFKFIFIITPALFTFSSATFLASYIDSTLLVIRAQIESQEKVHCFEDAFSTVDKPCACCIVDVEYPGDFMFR